MPQNEAERQRAVDRLAILDTMPEKIYDNIVSLASQICGVPIALISLIDEKRQWFKARRGLPISELSRDTSFCGHAILGSDLFEIEDARQDSRFAANPLVTGDPRIVFYAGAPLITSEGLALGSLCILDHRARRLTDQQKSALTALSEQVVALMEARVALQTSEGLRRSEARLRDEKLASDARADAEYVRLAQLFDQSPEPIAMLLGPEHVYRMANQPYRDTFGGGVEVIGRSVTVVQAEMCQLGLRKILDDVYRSGVRFTGREMPVSITSPDGASRVAYFDYTYDALRSGDGRIEGVITTAIDVTARVLRGRELETGRENLRSALARATLAEARVSEAVAVAKVGFYDWDVRRNEFVVSDQIQGDWGLTGPILTLSQAMDLVVPEDRDRTVVLVARALQHRESYHTQYRIRRPADGRVIWIESEGRVTHGEDGRAERFFGTSIDITEKKRLEGDAQAVANLIPQLAWMTDHLGYITWYNQRWYDYTGTTPDQMRGWGWQSVHHPDEVARVTKKFKDHMTSGEPWEDVFPLRGRDGEYRWFLSRANPIRDDAGQIVRWFGSNTDITAQREAEYELTKLAALVGSSADFHRDVRRIVPAHLPERRGPNDDRIWLA